MKRIVRCVSLGIVAAMLAVPAMAQSTWTGGEPTDQNWSSGANWDTALGNSTTASAVFNTTDMSATIPKNVDGGDWEIGGLSATPGGGTHILDLQGNTLTIGNNGNVYFDASGGFFWITNGTLVATNNIDVRRGTFYLTNNATLTGPQNIIYVGYNNNNGVLDTRGGSFAGGKLEANQIRIGASNRYGYFYITSLSTLIVHDNLLLNSVEGLAQNQRGGARIGYPDPARGNQWYLPDGVDIYIGSESSRGKLHVDYVNTAYGATFVSRLAASGGGVFEAWLTDFVVADTTWTHGNDKAWGEVDLRGMGSMLLDATEARIGVNTGNNGVLGYVWLDGGTGRVERLYIGDDLVASSVSLLDLSNTVFKVADVLDMKSSTEIKISVLGTGSGLDLSNDVSIVTSGTPEINVSFLQEPATPVAPYYGVWGVRQRGNHAAFLGSLASDGIVNLQIGTFPGSTSYKTGVYFDSDSGYTYAAMVTNTVSLPPAVTAQDISVEVDGDNTVRIYPDDLLLAVYNPDNLTESSRVISHSSINGGTEQAYIDFPTSGSLPVTNQNVTIKIYYSGGSVSASDSADVVFTDLVAATSANLTWSGDASVFTGLDRREWKWGANWVGDAPPDNTTAATVFFEDYDENAANPHLLAPIPDVGGLPTNAWTIGSLRAGNASGQHVLDLGGNTLKTTGEVRSQRLGVLGSADMVVTNGTIDIGGNVNAYYGNFDVTDVDMVLTASAQVTANIGTLTVTNGSSMSSTFNSLSIGTAGTGRMDMRGSSFVGGLLELNNLTIGGVNAYGYFYLNAGVLGTLRVHDNLYLNSTGGDSNNQRGEAVIGDPANSWRLPPDVNIFIGSSGARGDLQIAWGTSIHDTGQLNQLAVTSGGDFEAWLNTLVVGINESTSAGPKRGVLDLRNMDSFAMDVIDVRIALDTGSIGANSQVFLPSGDATMGDVLMGSGINLANSTAVLELNDTLVTVTNSLTLNAPAAVTNNIAGSRSSGLVLSTMPTVNAGATVTLVFRENHTHLGPHFGLKILGDHVAALQAVTGTWLSWDDSATTHSATIFEYLGDTYVGIPPPPGTLFMVR